MKITLNPQAKDAATRDALVAEGGFGKYYTDHMVICQWDEKSQDGQNQSWFLTVHFP
jgi:branched-chain amino acid aminotransferase